MKCILFLFFLTPSFLCAQELDRNEGVYLTLTPKRVFHSSIILRVFDNGRTLNSGVIDNVGTGAAGFIMESGYFLIPKRLCAGIGFGIEYNDAYQGSYLPLYFDSKLFLLKQRNSPLVFFNLGKPLSINGDTMKGSMFTIGLGQKIFFTNKLAAYFSAGYSISQKTYSYPEFQSSRGREYELNTSGFELKIGLFF